MNFLIPPKIMQWVPALDQHYSTDKKVLVVSGASFTASTNQLECAASWPGYLYDRCRFEKVIDLSYPGVGNEYVSDSIVEYFGNINPVDFQNYIVVIMWSGLGWITKKVVNSIEPPCVGSVSYQRKSTIPSEEDYQIDTKISYRKIVETRQFLEKNKISYAFTCYANLLFPPCLPLGDRSCTFNKYLTTEEVKELQKIPWVPDNPRDYLYDYAFFHDYDATYHPPVECNLKWTDQVLLPNMSAQGLITLL